MKYFYKILRLFFCPHKWKVRGPRTTVTNPIGSRIIGYEQTVQCQYCGKLRNFEV